MRQTQTFHRNPMTAGLIYFFALGASLLELIHFVVAGGPSLSRLTWLPGLAIVILGVAAAICISGNRCGAGSRNITLSWAGK